MVSHLSRKIWPVTNLVVNGLPIQVKTVQSFNVESKACVRVRIDVSERFSVIVGLRQGCVISSWLFNVYMDGVVREVNARVLGKG